MSYRKPLTEGKLAAETSQRKLKMLLQQYFDVKYQNGNVSVNTLTSAMQAVQ